MHLLLLRFLSFFVSLLGDLAALLLAFVIQKVVFLESHTWKQFHTYLRLLMIMTGLLLCMYVMPPSLKHYEFYSYLMPIVVVGFALFQEECPPSEIIDFGNGRTGGES